MVRDILFPKIARLYKLGSSYNTMSWEIKSPCHSEVSYEKQTLSYSELVHFGWATTKQQKGKKGLNKEFCGLELRVGS